MKSRTTWPLAACIAVALGTVPAVDSHAAEGAMLELIEILYKKGSIDEQEYQLLLKAAREDAGAAVAETDEGKIAEEVSRQDDEASSNVVQVTTEDRLQFKSAEGGYTWKIFGRVQTDVASYNSDTDINGNSVPLADFGQEIRRARIGVAGTIAGNWGLKVQYDFPSETLKDAFISYKTEGGTEFKLGHFKEPFSMSELTSSKYQTFMERPTSVTAFVPSRNTGIGVYHAIGDRATLSGGVFGDGIDSGGDGNDGSYAVTGRATVAPIQSARKVLHLGSAATYRKPDGTNTDRFRDRFETHVTDVRLVDTGIIEGIDSITKANFEIAAIYNRFSLQGEYLMSSIDRKSAMGGDLDFDGYYLLGSIFLTNDSRPYSIGGGNFGKVNPGSFSPVSPSKPIGRGGLGAWELGFSYHDTDLSDRDIDGGTQTVFGIALNWYPATNFRFQLNYNAVTDHDGGNFPGAEPSVLQARGQIFW